MMGKQWKTIEQEFLEYYEENNNLSHDAEQFLQKINFLDNPIGEISEAGEAYLDSKFIFENDEHKKILRHEILNVREIRELCQAFYGQKTGRENVERYFKSKTDISDESEVGRILLLLNSLNIVSYSKRQGTVQFTETEQVEEVDQTTYRITHRTPYSNIKRLRRAIRACDGELLWVAKHFPKKGLEPLSDEVIGEKFTGVRILCGPANVTHRLRDDFERFQEEMANREVEAELRVVTSKEILRSWHDRWILSSKGASWNVPPINSLYQDQEAEIHRASEEMNIENFADWWDKAKDVMEEWNDIQKYI